MPKLSFSHLVTRLALALVVTLAACGGGTTGDLCSGPNCFCPEGDTCTLDCPADSDCDVQCQPGSDCNANCSGVTTCDVECSTSDHCDVDCAGEDCSVTCPATGCTVHGCGPLCGVTCASGLPPTLSGTTATCP